MPGGQERRGQDHEARVLFGGRVLATGAGAGVICDLLICGQLEDLLEGVGQDAGRFDALGGVRQHLPPGPLFISPNGEARPVPQTSFSCFFLLARRDALGPLWRGYDGLREAEDLRVCSE